MTKDDIYFFTQAKKELEFKYRGNTYVLNYDKDDNGKEYIIFGPIYETKKYDFCLYCNGYLPAVS